MRFSPQFIPRYCGFLWTNALKASRARLAGVASPSLRGRAARLRQRRTTPVLCAPHEPAPGRHTGKRRPHAPLCGMSPPEKHSESFRVFPGFPGFSRVFPGFVLFEYIPILSEGFFGASSGGFREKFRLAALGRRIRRFSRSRGVRHGWAVHLPGEARQTKEGSREPQEARRARGATPTPSSYL